ncbi:MAG: biotin/lipoyl-containing protein [Planctomycetota bacterium]|nr:biotin/lipoyl-containing protein [Planctomycetota bacterium]
MKYQIEWDDQVREIDAQCDPLGREWKLRFPDGELIEARVETLEEGAVLRLITGGESKTITLLPGNRAGTPVRFLLDHTPMELEVLDPIDLITREVRSGPGASGHHRVQSIMPGIVRKILASPGDEIEAGSPILILEAMKMENEIAAPVSGTVAQIMVSEGDAVAAGAMLLVIDLKD